MESVQRFLKVKHALNIREVGGFMTADHKWQIKPHKLIRSGMLGRLTYAEKSYLWHYGVRVVCDLRTPNEAQLRPDKLGWRMHYQNVAPQPYAHSALAGIGLRVARQLNYPELTPVQQNYVRLLSDSNSLAAYKQMIMLLLANTHPKHAVLIHCTAGKERTGVAFYLILNALGIAPAAQITDYMLSNLAFSDISLAAKNYWAQPENLQQGLKKIPPVPAVAQANWEFLDRTAHLLGNGSVVHYLERYLGIDEEIRQQLRQIYLMKAGEA